MLSDNKLKLFLTFARQTAVAAGYLLRKRAGRKNEISFKGRVNLVTEADLASEKLIVGAITKTYSDHSILTEEKASVEKKSRFRWVIDPLDGTTNYAHGFPFWAVSIGLEYDSEIIAGVIYDPLRDELFYARKNGGAFLNRKRIAVSVQNKLDKALLATGFPYDIAQSENNNLNFFNSFALAARGVRRAGSAALDLCYLACGRFDGFWEQKLHPWDTAAGKIIVEEAGGKITDFEGKKYSIYDNYILGSNRKIHNQMIKILTR